MNCEGLQLSKTTFENLDLETASNKQKVITENIVRMIILLINNQNVKDKGYDLKGGNECYGISE